VVVSGILFIKKHIADNKYPRLVEGGDILKTPVLNGERRPLAHTHCSGMAIKHAPSYPWQRIKASLAICC